MKRSVDYIGVGVGAVIVDERGRLFLARRGPKTKNERGLWEFPGGSVEMGETLAEALRREMREEYGVEIEVGKLLDVVDHILPDEGQHWVSPAFVCALSSGEPTIREAAKCTAIAWFAPDEMPDDLTRVTQANFSHYREQYLAHEPAGPQDKWSAWRRFPDPRKGEYLYAPFGPGVYELRHQSTGEPILLGQGKNVAYRMSSLLPAPWGQGHRSNEDKRSYVMEHIQDVEYRTLACASEEQAKHRERWLKQNRSYIFST